MYKDYPEFLYDGQLTDAGHKVVAYIEATLEKALSLSEGTQDVTALNNLSGHFKDYYVNVTCMTYYQHKPEGWVKDRRPAVIAVWEQIQTEEAAAATAATVQQQSQSVTDLAAKLDTLQQIVTDLVAKLTPAPAAEKEEEDEEAAEPEDAPKKVGRPKKAAKPEASETPAADDAEGEPQGAE